MWPGSFAQTLVPAAYGVSIWNLSSTVPAVSEMFENVDKRTDRRQSHEYTINNWTDNIEKVIYLTALKGERYIPILNDDVYIW